MQKSHWHLMFRHFCPNLVSRNSTATTVSMHHCIVSLLKPWRTLRRGYTPPKKWSRHVEITCSLHCMQLEYPRTAPGNIHAIIGWSALAGPAFTVHRFRTRQCQSPEHLISSGGSCIAWVFFLEKGEKAPGESSSKAIHDPTVPTRVGRCTM